MPLCWTAAVGRSKCTAVLTERLCPGLFWSSTLRTRTQPPILCKLAQVPSRSDCIHTKLLGFIVTVSIHGKLQQTKWPLHLSLSICCCCCCCCWNYHEWHIWLISILYYDYLKRIAIFTGYFRWCGTAEFRLGGPLRWKFTAVKVSLCQASSRSEYSFTCFACCQKFGLCNSCLPSSFGWVHFSSTSVNIKWL